MHETKSVKLSKLISKHVPGHVRDNYDTFVKFLEYYYEWLEEKYGPADTIRNWDVYNSVDTDVDEFVNEFKNEVLYSIPVNILADKKRLIKHAREFYTSKGNEASFKFLFRILFNEDIEIYYPKEDIFRLSDGNWIKNDNILVTTSLNDPEKYLYKRIRQTRVINEFTTEEANGIVIKVQRFTSNRIQQSVFFLSEINGEFKQDYPVYLEEDESIFEYPHPIVTDVEVVDGGTGYKKGDRIVLQSNGGWEKNYELDATKIIDLQITSILTKDEITVEVNSVETSDYEFDGRYIDLSNFNEGDSVKVILQPTLGYIEVDEVDGNGEILETRIYDFPIGHTYEPEINIETKTGSGGDLNIKTGTIGFVPGYYLRTDGFLSDVNYLLDSLYYQEYSYVIRTSRSVDTYADIVKRVLHPAGMKMFGEISLFTIIQLIIRSMKSYYEIEFFEAVDIESEQTLHTRVSSFDKHKLTYEELDMRHYEDLILGNIFDNFDTKWDFGIPSIVDIEVA